MLYNTYLCSLQQEEACSWLLAGEAHLTGCCPCSGYFDDKLETFVEIPSDNVPFNEAPDMKAREITEAGKEALLSGKFQMVRVNFANPGMFPKLQQRVNSIHPPKPSFLC